MKTLFTIFLLIFISQNSYCQVSGKIAGNQGEAIPFVSVLLLNTTDSSLVKGTLSDEEGFFQIDYSGTDNYFLRASFVGYKNFDSPAFELNASQGKKAFGLITLSENVEELEGIVVVATKPLFEQQIDRTVVNVQNSVMTKGSSALQVLERSPGMLIDRRNNDIIFNGKTGVMVMMNGKLMRLPVSEVVNMLNGINADNIEKIELFTSPPAKYDAEGSAGMINIVLKKNEDLGTNGSLSVTGGYGWTEKGLTSLNLNHRKGKMNLYGTYSFAHDASMNGFRVEGSNQVPVFGDQLIFTDFQSKTNLNENSHNTVLGVDIDLDEKTIIGGNVTFNTNDTKQYISNRAAYQINEDSLLIMQIDLNGKNRWDNLMSNIYMEKTFTKGGRLNLDFDYLYYQNKSPYQVGNLFFNATENEVKPSDALPDRQRGASNMVINIAVAKLDYGKQLGENIRWEAGLKGTYSDNKNIGTLDNYIDGKWAPNTSATTHVDLKERIGAVYSSFNLQINPKTNMIIGARYEYWNREIKEGEHSSNRNFGRLFPTLFFSRKLSEKSDFQMSYSKRTSRPTYNDLASNVRYNGPLSVFSGNPFLQATISHNLKFGYNHKDYSFSLSLGRDNNPVVRFQITESPEADLMYVSPQNMKFQNNLTLQSNLPFKITDWWTVNLGLTADWRQFQLTHTKEKISKTYFTYNINGSQNFTLPKNFSVELSGWYNAFTYNGSVQNKGFGMLNFGVKKQIRDNHTLQLSVTDIFKSMKVRFLYGALTGEAFNVQSQGKWKSESANARIIKLTYLYSFGSGQGRKNRGTGSKEERERIRKE